MSSFFTSFYTNMSSIKTILYTQKTLKNGENPVMLYVYDDKPYRVSLGYSCTPKQWNKEEGRFRKNMDNFKTKNLNLRKLELKANDILDDFVREGKRFDVDLFKDLFFEREKERERKKEEKTFYEFFNDMINEKQVLGKIGTMLAYKDAYSTLKKYKSGNLKFPEITYSLLKGLEIYLLQRGCTNGGIGARMRSIKAVFYEGIRRDFVSKECNPFSTTMNKNGYSLAKLKSERNPKSLSTEEIELLKGFDYIQHPTLIKSYLYFMFSFRMFGMNFADMCDLEKKEIHDGRIVYKRNKTGRMFNLKISEEAQQIIDYYATEQKQSKYIFPILNEHIHKTPTQIKNRTHKVLRKVNKDLKTIAKLLSIETPITFYVARHSSATTLKRNGISTEIISEALGHANSIITQRYLKNFDNSVLDSAMAVL